MIQLQLYFITFSPSLPSSFPLQKLPKVGIYLPVYAFISIYLSIKIIQCYLCDKWYQLFSNLHFSLYMFSKSSHVDNCKLIHSF